jgi:uncharacterized membrane protein YhaH (DUF805 family)
VQYFALLSGIVAAVFYFLAFVYPDIGKETSKEKLRNLNTVLHNQTLFQIGKDYFSRIVNRVGRYNRKNRQFWYFLCAMFFLNILIIPGSCLLVEYIKHQTFRQAWDIVRCYKIYQAGLWRSVFIHFSAGLIGLFLNLISLSITLKLLRKMAAARNWMLLLFHILVNCLVVAWFAFFLLPTSVLFNWLIADKNGSWKTLAQAWHGTYHDKPDILIPILYGASSGIPTVIYLLTGLAIISLKLFPESVRRLIIDTITALTREDRNVFSDIGRFFTVLGGLAGVAKFLFG